MALWFQDSIDPPLRLIRSWITIARKDTTVAERNISRAVIMGKCTSRNVVDRQLL